jgi:two-component system, chemotaxis family, CheB/CheR fusion protein
MFAAAMPDMTNRLRGMRVLLVDDNADIRDVFALLLTAEGAQVITAATGREAIDLARRDDFDVLLTDFGLPDFPGDTVIRYIVAAARQRPWIVVITGYGEPFVGRARKAGADIILTKPIVWEWMTDRLDTLVGRQRAA